MKPLGIGIVGCGWISEIVHMPNLKARPDVVVAAYADHAEGRRQVAAKWFPKAKSYLTAEEMLRDPGVDAVIVAIPPVGNRAIAEQVLSAGKHIYLEKPLAINVTDAIAITAAWRASKRIAMLGYNFRFNPAVERAQSILASGALGRVIGIQSRFTWTPQAVENWRADAAKGGGVLLDLASHHIDLFQSLLNSKPDRVSAHERSVVRRADTIDLVLEVERGSVMQLHASLAGGANVNRISVLGELGQIDIDVHEPDPQFSWRSKPSLGRLDKVRRAFQQFHPAHILRAPGYEPSFSKALEVFIKSCRLGVQPLPNPEQGLDVLRVVEAARLSAQSNGTFVPIESETAGRRIEAVVQSVT